MTDRRSFIRGLAGFVACAPAIVRVGNLMALPARCICPISIARPLAVAWNCPRHGMTWRPELAAPAYGRSPAMDVLDDVRAENARRREEIAFMEGLHQRLSTLKVYHVPFKDAFVRAIT